MTLERIEFPAIVKNSNKAINILGGPQKIYQCLNNPEPKEKILQISFRPGDSLSHPITSENSSDPAILIRIKCVKTFIMQDGKKVLKDIHFFPEIVGSMLTTNSFNQPSDFQFLPPLSTHLDQPTVEAPPPQSFLYLPPPIFLHNYHYNSMYIQKRIFANQQYENAKIWKDNCPWMVNQSELLTMENGPHPPPPASDVTDELLEVFSSLFSERPIWTTIALFDRLNEDSKNSEICNFSEQSAAIYHSISCVAYQIKNGPYNSCWIRYGINPILRNNYCRYQSIVFSLKDWGEAEKLMKRAALLSPDGKIHQIKKISSLPKGMSKLNALPNRLFFAIQLCDFQEPFIDTLITNIEERYSFQTGWYNKVQIETIRKFAMLKLQRLLNLQIGSVINPKIIMSDIHTNTDLDTETEKGKEKTESFDFEFLNTAKNILGLDSIDGQETKEDLFNQFTQRAVFIGPTDRLGD